MPSLETDVTAGLLNLSKRQSKVWQYLLHFEFNGAALGVCSLHSFVVRFPQNVTVLSSVGYSLKSNWYIRKEENFYGEQANGTQVSSNLADFE